MEVDAVDAVLPVDDPPEDEVEVEVEDDDENDPPPCLGPHPVVPNKLPLEGLGVLGVSLEPWVKRIYNDVLRMMLQDQEQLVQGREIANVTMTNSIVTSYKQGGRPSVQSTSSRLST